MGTVALGLVLSSRSRNMNLIRTSETSRSVVTLFCLERLRDKLGECGWKE